eukprot:scaffold139350_cov19-Tisochrysis_lutea.AAC.1
MNQNKKSVPNSCSSPGRGEKQQPASPAAAAHRETRGLREVSCVFGHQVAGVEQVLKLAADVGQLVCHLAQVALTLQEPAQQPEGTRGGVCFLMRGVALPALQDTLYKAEH